MTVKNVTVARQNEDGAWIVDYDDQSAHGFPVETLSWRAAEYGIDPSDADTLLGVVLHEPYVGLKHTDPTFVYNVDEQTARAAHLDRVAKSPVQVKDPAGHLDAIRAHHLSTFNSQDHADRVSTVRQIRAGRGSRIMSSRGRTH